MTRTFVLTALSGFALLGASPALAQRGGHQGTGGSPTTVTAPTTPMGSGPMSNPGVTVRDTARANSQGPANASATGIENANQNSVLSSTTTTTTPTDTTTKTNQSHRPPR